MSKRIIAAVAGAAILLCGSIASAQTKAAQDAKKLGVVKVNLRNNNATLTGVPVNLTEIKINGLFGEASIPLDSVAGIRFAQGSSEQTTVQLLNGDSLTGQVPIPHVEIVTEWGECKINVPSVSSIMFRSNATWSQNGKRWELRQLGGTPVTVRTRGR